MNSLLILNLLFLNILTLDFTINAMALKKSVNRLLVNIKSKNIKIKDLPKYLNSSNRLTSKHRYTNNKNSVLGDSIDKIELLGFGQSDNRVYFKNENFYPQTKVAIIGLGHLGKAIAKGLISQNTADMNTALILSPKNNVYENIFFDKPNVWIAHDNREAVAEADIVILAIKPLVVKSVLSEIEDLISDKILVSTAAGISIELLKKMVSNPDQKIVRVMPNLPLECQSGFTGVYCDEKVKSSEKLQVIEIFQSMGKVLELICEKHIDIITVVGGCGPALVSHIMEGFIDSSRKLGLTYEQSKKLVLNTFMGTCNLLESSNMTTSNLIESTATKDGATAQIIKEFQKYELKKCIDKSLERGLRKIESLEALGKSQL